MMSMFGFLKVWPPLPDLFFTVSLFSDLACCVSLSEVVWGCDENTGALRRNVGRRVMEMKVQGRRREEALREDIVANLANPQ